MPSVQYLLVAIGAITLAVVAVLLSLRLRSIHEAREEAERLGEGRWRLGVDVLSADVNGLPLLTGGRSWPLEAAE